MQRMIKIWLRHFNTTAAQLCATVATLILLSLSGAAYSQNLFAAATLVNDSAITRYEVNQRILLLEFLRTTGDLAEIALERLVDERLQAQAAARAGITVSDDELSRGIDEFAGRANLGGDEFINTIAQAGIAPDGFREFVRVGIAWRGLVRSRFASAGNISDAEINREIALNGSRGSAEVQISEIFLPTNSPNNQARTLELAPLIAEITTIAEFSDAARRFSAGPSRDRGGVVDQWVPLNNLPAPVRAVLLSMKPGEVTEPIEISNALALFQLRALRDVAATGSRNPTVDYAAYFIPGGQSATAAATRLRDSIDTCDDLYAVARNQPERLIREEQPLSQIPADYALNLARLDANEASFSLTRASDNALVFLMLCNRNLTPETEVPREQIRLSLSNRRLSGLAAAFLDELRANATIRTP
jgi:peptidyl-prolyl cis-trans isomerase SurA